MSDIYAMGVDPIIGLNIAAFQKTFLKKIIKEILNGSKSKCDEAGLNIVEAIQFMTLNQNMVLLR